MTCRDAREYLFAFLDNELDAALSIEVQLHLEHCPVCARECEIERLVRRRLEHHLRQGPALPEFDASWIIRAVRGEPRKLPPRTAASRSRRRLRLVGALAVVVGLLTAASFVYRHEARRVPDPLVVALVDDFEHFTAADGRLQVESPDARVVSAWLAEQTALPVALPQADRIKASLLGGRKCEIRGRPAAFAVYRIGDRLASLVVVPEAGDALASMRQVGRDGHAYGVERYRDHTVVACRRGRLMYAAVSTLPEQDLTWLMHPSVATDRGLP